MIGKNSKSKSLAGGTEWCSVYDGVDQDSISRKNRVPHIQFLAGTQRIFNN